MTPVPSAFLYSPLPPSTFSSDLPLLQRTPMHTSEIPVETTETVRHKFAVGDEIIHVIDGRCYGPSTIAAIERQGDRHVYRYAAGGHDGLTIDNGRTHHLAPKFAVGDWITWGTGCTAFVVDSIDYAAMTYRLSEGFHPATGEPSDWPAYFISVEGLDSEGRIAEPPPAVPLMTTTVTIEHSDAGGAMNVSIPAAIRQALKDPEAFGGYPRTGTASVTVSYSPVAADDTTFSVTHSK